MITECMALQLAQTKVDQLALDAGDKFQILETKSVDHGWLFFFNTSEFVSTGNPVSALAGNGPIFVSHKGDVFEFASSVSWEDALRQLL